MRQCTGSALVCLWALLQTFQRAGGSALVLRQCRQVDEVALLQAAVTPVEGAPAVGEAAAAPAEAPEQLASLLQVQPSSSIRPWGSSTEGHGVSVRQPQKPSVGVASASSVAEGQALPFAKAFVLSIDAEGSEASRERLEAQKVPVEVSWGFNGKNKSDLEAALALLKRYGHTDSLHPTVSNFMACMHMAPGTKPKLQAALSELAHTSLWFKWARNVDELLAKDTHGCVPKVVAIAATHIRLWEKIAAGPTTSNDTDWENKWYLVMEDDAALCPGWRERLSNDLPQAPKDADVLKLFFFGHWRNEDQVPSLPGNEPSPFLEARDPLNGRKLVTAAVYEMLEGATWDNVPFAGFYAGTQAYLINPRGARKLLKEIHGKPFQDIDMTMMTSVKNYVWRKVLTRSAGQERPSGGGGGGAVSMLQTVPVCNREPSKDWFF